MKKLIVPAIALTLAGGGVALATQATPHLQVAFAKAPVSSTAPARSLLARTGDVYITVVYTKQKASQVAASAASLDI